MREAADMHMEAEAPPLRTLCCLLVLLASIDLAVSLLSLMLRLMLRAWCSHSSINAAPLRVVVLVSRKPALIQMDLQFCKVRHVCGFGHGDRRLQAAHR